VLRNVSGPQNPTAVYSQWTRKEYIGSEILTAVVMKSNIFWDITRVVH
jgi:hypothetical protein